MKGFERSKGHLVARFDVDEAPLLAGLVDQLAELLTDNDLLSGSATTADVAADPFARWEAEFSEEVTVETLDTMDDEPDPVIKRLFPDAYRDDPAASWEFRRFTQSTQRNQKVAEAELVMADLSRLDRRHRCTVPDDHVGAWLKTLASLRLAMAVRLDITDEVSAEEAAQRPEGDPRAWLHEVYQWLGWVQESLLEALSE